jgi:hypothetical protein
LRGAPLTEFLGPNGPPLVSVDAVEPPQKPVPRRETA